MLANLKTAYGDVALRRGHLAEAKACLAQAIEISPEADELARTAVSKLARGIEAAGGG